MSSYVWIGVLLGVAGDKADLNLAGPTALRKASSAEMNCGLPIIALYP
jgi:hypothetical protein